ncbi:LysR family transcriptional regulator [Caballeronia sp. LjRoot34]|uniref:LysR family transcriptional regulator n=1 Tax=Caballeronia sp. LjRoot34 TaxID=3342325 RepID=UPI003ED0F7AB
MFPGELREFLAVVRTGSIRKASELLGVAPSSVSRKVAVFEHLFGTALFERTTDGAVLTPSGSLVADYARSVIADYDNLRADLNDLRGTKRRVIRITTVESVVSGGLVRAVTAFRSQFDTLTFRVNVVAAPMVPELLRKGECDIGLTFCGQAHSDFATIAKVAEPIVAAVGSDHPLAEKSSVAISELANFPLGLPDATFGVRAVFDRAWHEMLQASDPNIAITSNSFESLRDFARQGGGCSILPTRAVPKGDPYLRRVRIDNPYCENCTVDIMVLRKNRLPKVIEQFLDRLTRILDEDA